MTHIAVQQIFDRVEASKGDSDFTFFFTLLLAGEALTKLCTLGLLAAIVDDKERNRYRLEHFLARANGVGDWSIALEDILSGPASQYLLADAYDEQAQLSRVCRAGEWQHECVTALKAANDTLGIKSEDVPPRTDMKRWFRLFAELRNGTRAHGATLPSRAGAVIPPLVRSLELLASDFTIFRRPWVYLHRNYGGNYRVSRIAGAPDAFSHLKKETSHTLTNGIYVMWGSAPRRVPLADSDPELRDFYFANGKFGAKHYELLSYVTDDKIAGDAGPYLGPPGVLPESETEGRRELHLQHNCLSTVPAAHPDYISRPQLEAELTKLLLDDRRPVITLLGAGGTGKTSLTLQVLNTVSMGSRFNLIVWLSARDVDLMPVGPKPVRRHLPSPEEIAGYYAHLVLEESQIRAPEFNARAFFEAQLTRSDVGPCLFVFDNFETTQNPVEMYSWLDTFIRLPNKILITTRLREFKGDYPLEVGGMTRDESLQLIHQTSEAIGIRSIMNDAYADEVIDKSGGHPYVIKMLLGEVANAGKPVNIPVILAARDDVLTALFERTFAALGPCGQRALLTLAAWQSAVPRVALAAVLLRSTQELNQVEGGLDALLRYSLVESFASSQDGQEFFAVPLVTAAFGRKKLSVSPLRPEIMADVEILKMLGPSRRGDVHLGLALRLERYISNLAQRAEGESALKDHMPMIEMMCRSYPPGWLIVARWLMEGGRNVDYERARTYLNYYLENSPRGGDAAEAWRMLANACFQIGDQVGNIHAFVERAQLAEVPFADISNTANRLNKMLYDAAGGANDDPLPALAQRLLRVLDRRRAEADATGLSRMAWLAIHLGQDARAIEYVRAGLQLEWDNYHCQRLAERLHLN